jgi:hypothetical protein
MAFNFSTANITKIDANSVAKTINDAVERATKDVSSYVGNYIPSNISGINATSAASALARASTTTTSTPSADPLDNFKVKLISATSLRNKNPADIERVVFNVSPTVTEDRSVEYSAVSPIHMPGSVQVYKRTNARTFAVSATLISRTRQEATANMKTLQLLRGWTLPYFGVGSGTGGYTDPKDDGTQLRTASELLGAPPDVLYFYAYSSSTSRKGTDHVNINRIPVVLSQLSIAYPDDVDYIPTTFSNKEPMPAKMLVTLSLLETHSPYEFEHFSLQNFKLGQLKHF